MAAINFLIYFLFLIHTPSVKLESDDIKSKEAEDKSSDTVADNLINYKTPNLPNKGVFLYEHFDNTDRFKKRWIQSEAVKPDSEHSKYDGQWQLVNTNERIPGDNGLMMSSKARHHAISTKLDKAFDFSGSNLIVQYDAQFRNGQECGGAYLKLLAAPSNDLKNIHDKTTYSIMFGPDKCGNEHKIHFIFNHKHKLNNSLREIHWKKASSVGNLNDVFTDNKWHLFRLIIKPDNSFEILMDKKSVGKGSLLEDFSPSVNPPKEINDPEDTKPEDWDERERIPDPEAKKPDDWDENEPRKIVDSSAKMPSDWLEDEPEMIPDSEAKKPADWSEDMDGEWEPPLIQNPKCKSVSGCGSWKAPLIDNPKYKGKWKPPLIPNPAYQGKWAPRKISNPDYFEDPHPYKMSPIDAVAFELWTISDAIVFDNVLITSEIEIADELASKTYQLKKEINDEKTDNWFTSLIKSTNKRPWLWAVYFLVVAVPLILFIGFCCVTPGRKSKTQESCKVDKEIHTKQGGDEVEEYLKESEKEIISGEEEEEEEEEGEGEEEEQEQEQGTKVPSSEKDVEVKKVEEEDDDGEESEEEQQLSEEQLSKPRLRKNRPRKD